jgi:tetratricopeptide (TPR) repeat protein
MRRKYKNRKKARLLKAAAEAVQTFSQFVESANDRVIGRSPSVLPVMEDLLRDALPPAPAIFEKRSENLSDAGLSSEFHNEPELVEECEGDRRLRLKKVRRDKSSPDRQESREIWLPWYTIPTALIIMVIPIILCALKLQPDQSTNNIFSSQSNQGNVAEKQSTQSTHLNETENQFSNAMESGWTSTEMGDYDEAIVWYRRAVGQTMNQSDKIRLYSALRAIEKKVPLNANVQTALTEYFEATGQLAEAKEAYKKAIQLSPEHHVPML